MSVPVEGGASDGDICAVIIAIMFCYYIYIYIFICLEQRLMYSFMIRKYAHKWMRILVKNKKRHI
jgi:hypothetical protein